MRMIGRHSSPNRAVSKGQALESWYTSIWSVLSRPQRAVPRVSICRIFSNAFAYRERSVGEHTGQGCDRFLDSMASLTAGDLCFGSLARSRPGEL